jgi:hypothetical protein
MAGRAVSRGYGSHHKRLRESWARRVGMGGVAWARCGNPLSRARRGVWGTLILAGPCGLVLK